MATYQASDINKNVPGIDAAAIYFGNATPGTATATGDLLQPCKIAAGVAVLAVLVNVRVAFGAAAPASFGISHVDGSTPAMSGPATKITAAGDTIHQQAAGTTKLIMPVGGPFVTEKDSYLLITFGAITTGAAGNADYVVIGEFRGAM